MTPRYTPQFLWLLAGPFIGALSGATVATLLIWSQVLLESESGPELGIGLLSGAYLGGLYGGIFGGAVGIVSSVPLVFLVGAHLPRNVARRRARVLGAVIPPLALLGLFATVFGVELSRDGDWPGFLLMMVATALPGSLFAGWLAGLDDPPRRAGTDPRTDASSSPTRPASRVVS